MPRNDAVRDLGRRLKEARERRQLSAEEVEDQLILGPGWMSRFESGESVPQLGMLLALLNLLEVEPSEFFKGLETADTPSVTERELYGVAEGADLLVHFNYTKYDAIYRLSNATRDEFEDVLQKLRHGLSPLADEAEVAHGSENRRCGDCLP